MRFSSDLLYRMIRAIGTGDSAPASQSLELFEGLVPVVHVPGPMKSPAVIVVTENQRESFAFSLASAHPASTAETDDVIFQLGRGLWRVQFQLRLHSDFTGVPSAMGAAFTIRDEVTTETQIARLSPIANVLLTIAYTFEILTPVDGWQCSMIAGVTAAGQVLHASAHGLVSRLN